MHVLRFMQQRVSDGKYPNERSKGGSGQSMYHVLPLYQFMPPKSDYAAWRSGDGTMPIRKI